MSEKTNSLHVLERNLDVYSINFFGGGRAAT